MFQGRMNNVIIEFLSSQIIDLYSFFYSLSEDGDL